MKIAGHSKLVLKLFYDVIGTAHVFLFFLSYLDGQKTQLYVEQLKHLGNIECA
jgi:hypothetical protein